MAELVDTILSLREQGYTNNQIIQYLQNQGYESYQIFDSMSQAEAQQKPVETPRLSSPSNMELANFGANRTEIEEVVEEITEEKWKTFEEGVKRIIEWKNETESRLMKIETDVAGLKESFSQMQGALFGKLSDYEKGIMDVSSEIKAMDKVFQKVIPTLSENVAELSKITKNVKESKRIKE